MSTAESATDPRRLEARLRQYQREQRALLAILFVVVLLALLDRVGSRVYAIAVWDPTQKQFVERAYLPQRAQAEEVVETLLEQARLAHPFYKDAPNDFAQAQPGFQEAMTIRRVRRVTALPSKADTAADLPVQRAVTALKDVLHVEVQAVGLFDIEASGAGDDRPLVVLPSEAAMDAAQEARLANIGRRVEEDLEKANARALEKLKGANFIVEKASFLQKVQTRPVEWPIRDVMTVQQAVEYLTHGDAPALHEVQAGENAIKIAAKYDAKVADLAKWNPGRDLNLLRVGEKLVVRRPEPPLTVLTVERRSFRKTENGRDYTVTVEIRRHDGEEKARTVVTREPVQSS